MIYTIHGAIIIFTTIVRILAGPDLYSCTYMHVHIQAFGERVVVR